MPTPMIQKSVRLTVENAEWLEAHAQETDRAQSHIINELIEAAKAKEERRAKK